MALAFRNITATPDDPVREWGFEGMLAALDRGGLDDWSKLARAVVAEPELEQDLLEALDSAETEAGSAYVRLLVAHLKRSPQQIALGRLRTAFHKTRFSQAEVARRRGTSRSRFSTYLSGKVTP